MIRRSIIVLPLALMIGACGVATDKHKKVLDELSKLKSDMAASEKSCLSAKKKLGEENDGLKENNRALTAKLVGLGQDVSKLQTQRGSLAATLTKKEQMIAELMKQQEAARKRERMFKGLLSKFQSMISSGKLKVSVRKGRMIVQMSDKILFDAGKDKLKKEGTEALLEVAKILAQIPDRQYQVAGHTDNVPIRTRRFPSNWELSSARAVNVAKYLADNGIQPKRLSAAGYGPYDPVGDNASDEGRQANRRIEITLMPNLGELPAIGGTK